jgi:hypothetical protein
MSKISTKHILYKNVYSSCTTPMYINHVHQHHAMCQNISSMKCINHMPLSICQHVHLPICQPCASTDMTTMCIYRYATMCIYQYVNHVHLPICQPCVISLMICLHHEPSATIMYLKQIPIVVLIK